MQKAPSEALYRLLNRFFSPRRVFAGTLSLLATVVPLSPCFAQADLAGAAVARYPKADVAEAPFDFYARGPYRLEVPKPDDLLGYPLGTWNSTYRDQERTLLAIADAAKDRVRVFEYGKSIEGRPLRLFVISTPENIAALDSLQAKNLLLTDPRRSMPAELDGIVRDNPAFVWINECIHGGETASFETAMATIYTLAASESPEIVDTLKHTIILVDPVANPDGHERFVVNFNASAMGSAESYAFEHNLPALTDGRGNHNRFDMNRDRVIQSQPETRQETAVYLRWYPEVFVDQHGQPETYFFPPNAKAINRNVDRERIEKWTDLFGRANGATFDQHGWAYVNRETFDFFYPGYMDSFTTLSGSIGETYETDGGGDLVRRRDDGTLSTLRDAAAHHFETALATIEAAAKNRQALLGDLLAYKRSALTPVKDAKDRSASATMRRVVILPDRDTHRAAELAANLLRLGIEVGETTAPIPVRGLHSYEGAMSDSTIAAGALLVDLEQPQGHLARAILESDSDMEDDFVRAQLARRDRNDQKKTNEPTEEYGFYDTTAWSLPLTYGLEAFALPDKTDIASVHPLHLPTSGERVSLSRVPLGGIATLGPESPVVYAVSFDTDDAAVLGLRLLQEGYRISTATRTITVNGTPFAAGSLFLRPARNPTTLPVRLDDISRRLDVPVRALTSAYGGGPDAAGIGSESVNVLQSPHIAVAAGDGVSETGYGSVAYALNQSGIRFTAVSLSSLMDRSVRANFNVIVLPDGDGYSDGFGKDGIAALKDWVNDGGCLIGLGGGATWATDPDAKLTSIRPVGPDKSADSKTVDHSLQPISLPGALFRAKIDPTHFLGYGYPGGILTVPLAGSRFWRQSDTGSNVVTFSATGPSRLSGFVWPNNTEKLLAGTVYAADEPIGAGHLLLFLRDPTERAMYPGLRRLFLSALLYSPKREISGP